MKNLHMWLILTMFAVQGCAPGVIGTYLGQNWENRQLGKDLKACMVELAECRAK